MASGPGDWGIGPEIEVCICKLLFVELIILVSLLPWLLYA